MSEANKRRRELVDENRFSLGFREQLLESFSGTDLSFETILMIRNMRKNTNISTKHVACTIFLCFLDWDLSTQKFNTQKSKYRHKRVNINVMHMGTHDGDGA